MFKMPSWAALLLPCAALIATIWFTFWDALKGTWVSDDLDGMARYDGKLQHPVSVGKFLRKFRYEYGKMPNPNQNWEQDKQTAFVHNTVAHHRLNLVLFSGVSIFLYSFLCRLFNPTIAFFATLLFIVHPLGCQTVAWISGFGYVSGFFFMLLGLNLIYLINDANWFATPYGALLAFGIYGLTQWLSIECMFAMMGVVPLLLWMHQYPFAFIAAALAGHTALNTFKEAISLRKTTFKEQQMERTTQLFPRKFMVAMKTLAYDAKLALFPKRLGLYHTFQYFYELPYVEAEDHYFWIGVCLLLGAIWTLLVAPPVFQFGILWFLSFVFIFLNWLTANQFVVDRYVWLPSFGFCLLVAAYAPTWLYWSCVGVALMRSWAHLPTYTNEIQFYHSNLWNFPSSEVAVGNLGVVYSHQEMVGSALDSWLLGAQMNPHYDVNWYNLSNMIRLRGPTNPNYFPRLRSVVPQAVLEYAYLKDPMRSHLHLSHYFLERALTARTCHFPKAWREEIQQMRLELSQNIATVATAPLIHPLILEVAQI